MQIEGAVGAADESIGPPPAKSAGLRMTTRVGAAVVAGLKIAHFGRISTVNYADSPFLRFDLNV